MTRVSGNKHIPADNWQKWWSRVTFITSAFQSTVTVVWTDAHQSSGQKSIWKQISEIHLVAIKKNGSTLKHYSHSRQFFRRENIVLTVARSLSTYTHTAESSPQVIFKLFWETLSRKPHWGRVWWGRLRGKGSVARLNHSVSFQNNLWNAANITGAADIWYLVFPRVGSSFKRADS